MEWTTAAAAAAGQKHFFLFFYKNVIPQKCKAGLVSIVINQIW